MNRTFLRDLRISGVVGVSNLMAIDVVNQKLFSGCYIEQTEIWIGEGCLDSVFHACHFAGCLIRLHPKGPGMKAFAVCTFDVDTKFDPK